MNSAIVKLAQYVNWQHDHLRDLLSDIDSEQWDKEFDYLGTLRKKVHHIMSSLILTSVIHQDQVDTLPQVFGSIFALPIPELLEKWKDLDREFLDFAKAGDTTDLVTVPHIPEISPFDISAEDMYLHFSTHMVYHRSEVMQLLKRLGKEVKSLDYLFTTFPGQIHSLS